MFKPGNGNRILVVLTLRLWCTFADLGPGWTTGAFDTFQIHTAGEVVMTTVHERRVDVVRAQGPAGFLVGVVDRGYSRRITDCMGKTRQDQIR